MEKIFACEECGQVYRDSPPEKCMKCILNGKHDSVKFIRIEEKDVLNIHDVPEFLLDMFLKKVSALFGF